MACTLGQHRQGIGVAAHCRAAIGRTGLVVGSVLVSKGCRPAEVVAWLDAVQRARGTPGWPESPWRRDTLAGFDSERRGSGY